MPQQKRGGTTKRNSAKSDGAATKTTTRARAKRGTASGKTFKLYAIDGDELTFLTESQGVSGPVAVQKAVERGDVQPGIPVVPLAPRALANPTTIEEEAPVKPKYKIVRGAKTTTRRAPAKRTTSRRPAAAAKDGQPSADQVKEQAEKDAQAATSGKRRTGRRPAPPTPSAPATSGNPFANAE